MSARAFSATQIGHLAYRALGGLRPGQGESADFKAEMLDWLNNMVDAWQIQRRKIFCIRADAYTLVPNQYQYTIGPGGQFDTSPYARPNEIEDANIILTTTTPVTRRPVQVGNVDQWSQISVQAIPNGIPYFLYYDKSFDANQRGIINIWPGSITGYQLELFTTQQLTQFADLTTVYAFPPGYAEALIWSLAERIYPMAKVYLKMEPDMNDARRQAAMAREVIESFNVPDVQMTTDPAMCQGKDRGDWLYLTGMFTGRG